MSDAVRRLLRLGAFIAAFVLFVATWNRRGKPMRGRSRLALLVVLPVHVAAQTAITNANIGDAATAWLTSQTFATTTYGNIVDWNTVAVTSMANVFYSATGTFRTFNADISKWNVASVSNMYQVGPLFCVQQTPRLLWRSLVGGSFSTALFGLGACSCRSRTRAWLPCLAHTLCCCCIGVPLPWLGLGWGACFRA